MSRRDFAAFCDAAKNPCYRALPATVADGDEAVAWGDLVAGATRVEFRTESLRAVTATVYDGTYPVWLPTAAGGPLVELAPDGSILRSLPVTAPEPPKDPEPKV